MSEGRSLIRLRYAARCKTCGSDLPPKTEAHWDKETRKATCQGCFADEPVEPHARSKTVTNTAGSSQPTAAESTAKKAFVRGTPGASAAREWTRRHNRREQQARDRYGRLGGIYLTFTEDPQSTRAWAIGTNGERALGNYLTQLDDDSSVIVLHDRRIPGSRANIDHIAITRNGIHAIDAKNYKGKVQRIDRGGWFSTDLRLYVGRRDCTKIVGGMAKQVEAIRAAIGQPLLEECELQIHPALCFVDAEWSLFAKPFQIDGVWIEWAKALGERLCAEGTLAPEHVRMLAERIAAALPAA